MRVCGRCNTVIGDNEEFCSRCGAVKFIEVPSMGNQGQMNNGFNQQAMGQMQQQPAQQMNRNSNQGNGYNQNMQSGGFNQGMQGNGYNQNMQGNGYNQGAQGNGYNQNMQNNGYNQNPQNNGYNQGMQNNGYNQNMQGGGLAGLGATSSMQGNNNFGMSQPMQNPQMQNQSRPANNKKKPKQNTMQNNQNTYYDNNDFEQMSVNNTGKGGFLSKVFITANDGSSTKDWILTMLQFMIPIWNIIFIIKCLKDVTLPGYKKTYIRAFLVYFVIALAISIVFSIISAILGAAAASAIGGLGGW